MPRLDGHATLQRINEHERLRHVPVIVITTVDELDSAARCIELGATDYLPKPFDPALLRARVNASLTAKRLRDLELEYLKQVGHLTRAAAAVEAGDFEAANLAQLAARDNALGRLARVFGRHGRRDLSTRVASAGGGARAAHRDRPCARDAQGRRDTQTDYFRDLRSHAGDLGRIMEG
jgi:two-component system cell cycle response regulator